CACAAAVAARHNAAAPSAGASTPRAKAAVCAHPASNAFKAFLAGNVHFIEKPLIDVHCRRRKIVRALVSMQLYNSPRPLRHADASRSWAIAAAGRGHGP